MQTNEILFTLPDEEFKDVKFSDHNVSDLELIKQIGSFDENQQSYESKK